MSATGCELCEAARLTEWFHEDEECWIAECESCGVPMVVWKDARPRAARRSEGRLHAKLLAVVAEHFDEEVRVDDDLRTIPDHYHAHARPQRWPPAGGLRRRR